MRCAMTNIDRNIQEDSLLFLDCFVNKDCGLLAQTSEKMLPDFLALISKLRNDSEVGRTLTLNLGSKLTSVVWRIKVLSRLQAIFRIILTAKSCPKSETNRHGLQSVLVDRQGCFPLYKEKLLSQLDAPCLDMFAMKSITNSNQPDLIKRHIMMMVPLLFETWLEVRPEQKALTGRISLNKLKWGRPIASTN